ncbi:lytic transglycosylase domain-containing protein [Pseudaestuariivita sp.]|uniref:lytic transglycosylase domain-containing protein n=1 Tax=Pseudaestuariivita sp. TaxID=2211669 RepID=UPI00405A0728
MKPRIFSALLCCALLWSAPGFAEETRAAPKPFPDFQAKRVKPPKAGATKRITVQIAPERAAPVEAQAAATLGGAQAPASLGWFWTRVSPDLADKAPGRLDASLVALQNAPDGQRIAAPRLQTLQAIAEAYGVDLLRTTVGTRVSPALALAVISVESAGRPDAVSSAGAQGLMQLMPATAARFGVTDRANAQENIRGGVAYLDVLLARFDNDPVLALAAYNAGEGAVDTHAGVPPFAETRDYVPKVLAAFQVARGLCLTPPELVTDGCVFRVASR